MTSPRWLEKGGKVALQMDSEAALADGWSEPASNKPTGAPWNPEPIGGELTQAQALAWKPPKATEAKAPAAKPKAVKAKK